ncbi:MAG: hypothetical protein VX913_11315 [Planctomycetota bacterium]|nr:hypothetical protein [Planctomycetota bacterium]
MIDRLLLLLCVVAGPVAAQPARIAWQKDLATARQAATATKRPLILYFTFDT